MKIMWLVFIAELDGFVKPFEREVLFAEQGIGRTDPKGGVMVGPCSA